MIPAISVPISLVGTFAVMLVLGYSLDNLSLMALTIAVFVSLFLLSGVVGLLFRVFAVTVAVFILVFGVRVADVHADDVRAAAEARS